MGEGVCRARTLHGDTFFGNGSCLGLDELARNKQKVPKVFSMYPFAPGAYPGGAGVVEERIGVRDGCLLIEVKIS